MRRDLRMKNNEINGKFLWMIASIILIGVSFITKSYLLDFSKVLFIIIVITGFGIFGYNLGDLLKIYLLKKYPDEERKIRIIENDERNITINSLAKSKAFDAMGYIFGTLIFGLALLKIELFIILLLVGAYILVYGIMLYYLYVLQKKM